ncbi:MAG: hypothetical protein QOF53_3620 [Nocardioidaceae bacterium]|nr:hypothetical protein [Nocardioidaceae bacterium]
MPDASGLLALGQALDEHLIGAYSPPPGTPTALGFLPGVAVNPSSFAPTGVVNPFAVQTFLDTVANVLGPVVDGRFAGFMSAEQIYGMVIDVASPLDPLGTPAADAFLSVKDTARSAFEASPVKQLVTVPMDWYDAAGTEGWSTFSTSDTHQAGHQGATSTGDVPPVRTPPVLPPRERFEALWRWRTLDPAATADLSEVSVHDRRSVSSLVRSRSVDGVDPSPARVPTTAPRRQLLASLAANQRELAPGESAVVRSTALARLIEVQAPVLVAEIDDDSDATSTQSVESDELTLSMEYCFVQVSRQTWWNDAILRMPRWYAPGCAAGAFSSGDSVGGLPLGVPIAMVLTRNVSVTGHWTEADRSAAESHTSFGPWSMRDAEMAYEESTEMATLTIPGMQVVAVVCALLPPLAPADDPALA